jgi:hypothetical protein
VGDDGLFFSRKDAKAQKERNAKLTSLFQGNKAKE